MSNKNVKTFYTQSILLTVIPLILFSCRKFLEITAPADQLTSNEVFTNDTNADAAVTGIYSEMMRTNNQFSSGLTTFYAGLCADELFYYSAGTRDEFTKNEITLVNHGTIGSGFWQPCYKYIYSANLCIEKLNNSTNVSQPAKSRIIGEAKFIRAFCYFYLVNLFGDVPLITTTDYRVNASLPRKPMALIYSQMVNDLVESENLLSSDYAITTSHPKDRTRPNKWAAAALLSRIYLYEQDWANAEMEATSIINSGQYSLVADLRNVFLMNSPEAIWQLQPVNPALNTWEGNTILPALPNSIPTYLLTPTLVDAFEIGDLRKIAWTGSRTFSAQNLNYPLKYKIQAGGTSTEYYTALRLSEQYLIRAEARIQQNNIGGAKSDINTIRHRAGLPGATTNESTSLLKAIEKERRTELFSEWGHRWFDLKRTGQANEVLGILKPATWQPADILWPIPIVELNINPNLTQNPGY